MTGGQSTDYLYGHENDDILEGRGGDDKLYGDVGSDDLFGGDGVDHLWGDIGSDDLYGGPGDDFLHVKKQPVNMMNFNRLCGGEGGDELEGAGNAEDLLDIPDGDAVEPHPAIKGSLRIEVNGPAGGGNNLRIVDTVSGISGPALISFVVAEHTLPDEYRIVWEGATQSQTHHTEVLFLDENGHEALRLTFTDQAGGIQALIIASGSESFDFIEVDPATPHEVLVTINPAEGWTSVRYDGSGGVEARQNLALKDPSFKKLKFVRFGGFNTTSAYFLSHLNIVAKSN